MQGYRALSQVVSGHPPLQYSNGHRKLSWGPLPPRRHATHPAQPAVQQPRRLSEAPVAQPLIVCSATRGTGLQDSKFRRSLWTAVDVAALLGSVVGALAALLGVVSPTYALTLPLVLPVVSLIAALQREDLINEVCRSCAWLSALYSSPWHLLPQHVACSSTVQQYSARTSAVYCFIIGISYTIGICADSPPVLSPI